MILLNKPPGLTPLQAIEGIRQNKKLSYAGRLNPMAEGLLLVLEGEENKKRLEFIDLPKTYEFEILFGVSTDTYDVMGKIVKTEDVIVKQKIDLDLFKGPLTLPYPPYSSKTVNGKPLHWYAKNNLLSTIEIPTKKIIVLDLEQISHVSKHNNEISASIIQRIERVNGDFRQNDILKDWKNFFDNKKTPVMQILKCVGDVTSGTYIRGIVCEMEKKTGIPMLAYTIKRTAIGPYTLPP